jgi:serine/threonine protein kinase
VSGLSSGISEAAETLCVREHASTDRAIAGGETVSRYVVLQAIGHGAMGRVLRAYDPKLQREVALKEVRGEVLDPVGAARLVAEARSMAKLSHPNVVAVYDVEELDSGRLVIAMEFVPGLTLREWIRRDHPTWSEIVARFIEAGRGLAAAHQCGGLAAPRLQARQRPGASGAGEVVKVTDFGIAKAIATPWSIGSEHPPVDR